MIFSLKIKLRSTFPGREDAPCGKVFNAITN